MGCAAQLECRSHRVYGMPEDEIDPIIVHLYRAQVGTWVVHLDAWMPAGFVDRSAVRCVVDDFGDLVVVR